MILSIVMSDMALDADPCYGPHLPSSPDFIHLPNWKWGLPTLSVHPQPLISLPVGLSSVCSPVTVFHLPYYPPELSLL